MRRISLLLALSFLVSWAALPARSTDPASPGPTPIGEFSEDLAFGHIRELAGRIGPRPAGSAAFRRAVRYAEGVLTDLGYRVRRMAFALPGGGRSWNVLATWPGALEPTLLIGGHLDTVQGSPGGNDNGSGVATILELARILAGTEEVEEIQLVAFGAEEQQPTVGHHIGSEALAGSLRAAERDALEVMISVDMIGKARRYTVGRVEGRSRAAARALVDAAHRVGLRARAEVVGDISDHVPFAVVGVPSALMWTGDEPNHHEPTDVVSNVSRRALRNGGRVLVSLIRDVV